MITLLADENINNHIIRGLLLRNPELDIVRAQDVGLRGLDDPIVLRWALDNNRILLTHDVNTIPKYAYELIEKKQPIPGILLVASTVPIGSVINDIIFIDKNSNHEEWVGQIYYLPL